MGILEAVSVGMPRPLERANGAVEASAIWKAPVTGRVALRGAKLEGDDQADRRVHGGPDQAVYAYAAEDSEWWAASLGRKLGPGAFGENLTVRGMDVTGATIGERWAIGTSLLEVTAPRLPCWKLARRMDDPAFVKRFGQAGRPGAYFRVVQEGELGAGDAIELVHRPDDHGITIALMNEILLFDHQSAPRLLAAPIPARTREWALGIAA